MKRRLAALLVMLLSLSAQVADGQSFGIELFNNVMPASGAMGGASIARPQDVQSAIVGNPSTMTQYHGKNFGFSGGWIEPTYKLSVAPPGIPLLFDIQPFATAKNDAQGIAAGNIAATHDLNVVGLPATFGIGLSAGAGAGVDFRHVPEANGTHATIVALDITPGIAVDVTDRLSVGATLMLSNATLDGPFVGITGSSSDYGLRGTVGFDYDLRPDTTVGAYWKTKLGYTFENLAGFVPRTFMDVAVDRPEIVGLGIANTSCMDGRLLIAVDAVYQRYNNTALFGAFFVNQWALQLGAQFTVNDRVQLRCGYAWNENPMRELVPGSAGGVMPPAGAAHIQYIQSLFAAIPQHRITGGLEVRDVLPGLDMSLFGGGTFEETQTFGRATATVSSYWVGTGLTWHYGCDCRK